MSWKVLELGKLKLLYLGVSKTLITIANPALNYIFGLASHGGSQNFGPLWASDHIGGFQENLSPVSKRNVFPFVLNKAI